MWGGGVVWGVGGGGGGGGVEFEKGKKLSEHLADNKDNTLTMRLSLPQTVTGKQIEVHLSSAD